MRNVDLAVGALIVVGLAVVGYGLGQPETVTEMTVEGPVDEQSIPERDVVTYDNLTDEQRQAFDRARERGGRPVGVDDMRWLENGVRYEGRLYEVSVRTKTSGRHVVMGGGAWLVVVAVGILGIVRLAERFGDR